MVMFFSILLAITSLALKAGATVEWISRPYSRLYVNAGETAKIDWKFPTGAKAIIYEYKTSNTLKRGTRIANVFGSSPTEVMKKYKGKVKVDKSGTLNLLNADVADEGFYSITITYKLSALTDEVEIKIQKAPSIVSISSHPKNEVFYKGMSLSLLCMAVGRPIPKVTWYKDELITPLREETGAVIYTIKSASKHDSGKYTCVAKNVVGQVNQTTEFIIYRKPYDIDFVHDTALDGTIFEGQSVTFTCSAKGSPPISTYQLLHNGKKIVEMPTGVYTIKEIHLKHDGVYCCIPINNAGLGENMTTFLRVHARPGYWSQRLKPKTNSVKTIFTQNVLTRPIITAAEQIPTKGNQIGKGTVSRSTLLSVFLPLVITLWITKSAYNLAMF